jgi:hypothetical protein
MKYVDGSEVRLGDLVSVPVPAGSALALIVMLGDSREHLELDPSFLSWVRTSTALAPESVVIEWSGPNPFAHNDPSLAPAGNYMFTAVDEWMQLKARSAA